MDVAVLYPVLRIFCSGPFLPSQEQLLLHFRTAFSFNLKPSGHLWSSLITSCHAANQPTALFPGQPLRPLSLWPREWLCRYWIDHRTKKKTMFSRIFILCFQCFSLAIFFLPFPPDLSCTSFFTVFFKGERSEDFSTKASASNATG